MNSVKTAISIIIPCYNAEQYLIDCLDSIFNQGLNEIEVIVVDDQSNDDSLELLKAYPIHVLRTENCKGPACARNMGAAHATSELLLFLDSDVILCPNLLNNVITAFKSDPALNVLQGVYTAESRAANIVMLTRDYYKYHKLLKIKTDIVQGINSFCFAIKREIFNEVKGFNIQASHAEDTDLGMRIVNNGYTIMLDKNIKVQHLKKYDLLSLLKCDYAKIKAKMKLMLLSKKNSKITFSLNSIENVFFEILSIALSPLVLFFPPLFLMFMMLNSSYIKLILKKRSIFIAVFCVFVLFLEFLVSFFAIIKVGIMYYMFKKI